MGVVPVAVVEESLQRDLAPHRGRTAVFVQRSRTKTPEGGVRLAGKISHSASPSRTLNLGRCSRSASESVLASPGFDSQRPLRQGSIRHGSSPICFTELAPIPLLLKGCVEDSCGPPEPHAETASVSANRRCVNALPEGISHVVSDMGLSVTGTANRIPSLLQSQSSQPICSTTWLFSQTCI